MSFADRMVSMLNKTVRQVSRWLRGACKKTTTRLAMVGRGAVAAAAGHHQRMQSSPDYRAAVKSLIKDLGALAGKMLGTVGAAVLQALGVVYMAFYEYTPRPGSGVTVALR